MFRRFLVLLLLHVAACLVAPAVAEARTGEPCACCDEAAPADDDGCCDDDLGACCAAPACVAPQAAHVPGRLDATASGSSSPACAVALIARATSPPPLPPPIG